MVIFGIHVSEETVASAAFAIIGFLIAINIWIRARSKKIEADAKVKVEMAQAELAERKFVMDSHKRQITINDQLNDRLDKEKALYEKRLADKEKKDESNYRVLSKVFDRHSQEIHDVLKKRFDRIETTLAEMPGKLQDGNKEWLQTAMGELAVQLADIFASSTMAQDWYPFPDANDPEWREEFVKPLVSKVRLYRRPVLSDASLTDAAILSSGETMEIIQGRKKGWLVVRLPRGSKALYGWLPEHEVLTGMNAVKLATGESAIIPKTSPIPAAT